MQRRTYFCAADNIPHVESGLPCLNEYSLSVCASVYITVHVLYVCPTVLAAFNQAMLSLRPPVKTVSTSTSLYQLAW